MFAGSLVRSVASRFALVPLSLCVAGGVASATGCATATTPSVSVADESTPTVRPVRARAGARHDGEAKLLVDDAILRQCPNVQNTVAKPFSGPATEAWLAILGSVADCVKTGSLAGTTHKIEATGSTHSSDAVRVVLTRLGVEPANIAATSTFDEGACVLDRSCPLSTVRLTLEDENVASAGSASVTPVTPVTNGEN